LLVLTVEAQREVARQHRRPNALVLVVSLRNGTVALAVLRRRLVCASRALGQLPLIAVPDRGEVFVHLVGVVVQVTSRPEPMVSASLPVPNLLDQPRPCSARPAASGSGPTSAASPAPWVLPKVWPPAISATVS